MGTSKKNEEEKRRGLDKRTPAQAAFEKMQEKRQMERILKKASKTHKQRVEDFNDTWTHSRSTATFPKSAGRSSCLHRDGAASRVRQRPRWGCVCFRWYILDTQLYTHPRVFCYRLLFEAVHPHSGT
ncbi:uncharacterized protein LOC116539725 [Sapajus apella]|uniref:Protein FAM32A n=1 Tax=Sapajus apella TaxID=9515 RepID=A0A6J3GLK3_SAPAP|nr:uncharacterized protein LOC116539725 [Sapajus apella]